MSYTRSTWIKGDVISSARLNNMENGILTVSAKVDNLNHSGTEYTALETQSEDFVSKITQTEGQVNVEHTKFLPAITQTEGNSSNAPKILFTIAGNNSNSIELTKATGSNYGATILSDAVDSNNSNVAASSAAVNSITTRINN